MEERSVRISPGLLPAERLDELLAAMRGDGYGLIGPTIREEAIVYDRIEGAADLPRGWTEDQQAGRYRLRRRDDDSFFGFNVGPRSWKQFLQVPRLSLWRARRDGKSFVVEQTREPAPKLALLGARSCDLHAIAVQDRVLLDRDSDYRRRRENLLVVAVQCGEAGGTCFCVSMGTGPEVTTGYDLVLTELLDDGRHDFLVEAGSEKGAEILRTVDLRPAGKRDQQVAGEAVDRAARSMGRTMETDGIRDLLMTNLEHPRWNDVASRCLACTNCTMVCPTCFCTTVEDVSDLAAESAERVRVWDSCYTSGHSYVHGGSVRPSIRERYRQWLTHKLATWIDQFGTSGCVGCGRCITWCPVGIDITEEVAAIRESRTRVERREKRN